jgi:hypothetical protein
MMQAKQQEDIVKRRVSTTVVRNELRLRKWGLGCERGPRLPAHPLAYDERLQADAHWGRAPEAALDPLTGWSRENAALSGSRACLPVGVDRVARMRWSLKGQ